MRTVDEYLRLPWTIIVQYHAEQGGYWSARVAELPGTIYATENREQLLLELDVVLRMVLESMIENGEPIPEPRAAAV